MNPFHSCRPYIAPASLPRVFLLSAKFLPFWALCSSFWRARAKALQKRKSKNVDQRNPYCKAVIQESGEEKVSKNMRPFVSLVVRDGAVQKAFANQTGKPVRGCVASNVRAGMSGKSGRRNRKAMIAPSCGNSSEP